MPTRLVSAISFALLTVFFFNVCVFGVVLSAELYVHKQEQQDKIKNKKHKEVIELRISRELVEEKNTEFQWVEDWEFRWQGEMYDIEKSSVEENVYVFSVKHDTEEDKLRKKIERNRQDETKERNAHAKKNLKCGSEFFEVVIFDILRNAHAVDVSLCNCNFPAVSIRSVPDPPPRMV